MQIKVLLLADSFSPHHEIVTLPEEKVEIAFSSPIYPTDCLVVSVRKGDTVKPYKPKCGIVDVTDFCASAGLVEITATLTVRGEAAKVWQIEPLIVKEINGGFAPVPQIVALESRVSTLEKALVELTKLTV